MREVRIVASSPQIDITLQMGAGPALITAGLGGWGSVERVDDIAMTDWQGQAPLQQSVPLMLDGWARGESVEREMNTIFKLGRDAGGDENIPPIFKVWGPIYFGEGKSWVLPEGGIDLDPESTIRRNDGELLRQAFTLHLLEYVRPDVIRLRGKKQKQNAGIGGNVAVGGTYTTKAGDTLQIIAARELNDWREWKAIGKKNGITDPNKKLPAGRRLQF